MDQVYNFSAGPAMLPVEVLQKIQKEFCNWHGMGISIMEISHRSKIFIEIARESEFNLRTLLKIPDNYKIIFCQGGARGQFSALPLNLFHKNEVVDYIISGYWSKLAACEAKKYCIVNEINIKKLDNVSNTILLPMTEWNLTNKSQYIHYCPNETIDGIAIHTLPIFFKDKIVIADYSSAILSKPLDINCFGIIYASAQKNIGPAGITLVIIREDLLNSTNNTIPSILNYNLLSKHNSMYNTPPTFSWYVSGMVFKWLINSGGLKNIELINQKKATLLYNAIDHSQLFLNKINPINRSLMNVSFHIVKPHLLNKFIKSSNKNRLYFLKGHKINGGIRASIYNAMPLSGVKKLINFMINFEKKYYKLIFIINIIIYNI